MASGGTHEPLHILCRAARAVDLVGVRAALTAGADPAEVGDGGNTPLYEVLTATAAFAERQPVAEILRQHGATLRARDRDDNSLLHCMANVADLEACRWLIAQNANTNDMNGFNQTPLHAVGKTQFALRGSRAQVAALLLQHGASPQLTDDSNGNALDVAVQSGILQQAADYRALFIILLQAGPTPSDDGRGLGAWLARDFDAELAQLVTAKGMEPALRAQRMDTGLGAWLHALDARRAAHAALHAGPAAPAG